MKQRIKKTFAFLLSMLLVISAYPASAPADTGEYGQLNLSKPRPIYINFQPAQGQDSVSLKEITALAGEPYTDNLIFWAQSPSTLKLENNYQTLSNLNSLGSGETGSVWVYDYAGGDSCWAIHVSIIPAGARPRVISIQLEEGQDSITLSEIAAAAGEVYTDQLAMYYPKPETVEFADSYQKLINLSSIPAGDVGQISVYDWATYEWAIEATFIPPKAAEKKYYTVTQTGTKTLEEILEEAGVSDSRYASYYLVPDEEGSDYSGYVSVDLAAHTVRFLTAELPEGGLKYKLLANGDEPCPFKLIFVADQGNINDGIFTYTVDKQAKTATVTGFVTGLDDEKQKDITIPSSVVWPRDDNGTAYRVADIRDGAFRENDLIETIEADCSLKIGNGAFEGCAGLTKAVFGSTENKSGTVEIASDAFAGCAALTEFRANFNCMTVETGAFSSCTGLETVVFTGKGSQQIKAGAFGDSAGIKYLRLDNTYDVNAGAFEVADGITFIQNNDAPLNDTLAKKIGSFSNYLFTANPPWWMNGNALNGTTARRVYIRNAGKNVSADLINAVRDASANLTDLYIDSAREEIPFADQLDICNANVKIHYQENHHPSGLYLDGSKGNDDGDGTRENPFRTVSRVMRELEQMDPDAFVQEKRVEDTTMSEPIAAACAIAGVNIVPGVFMDIYEFGRQATILNTVKVTGEETWHSGEGNPVVLIRDSGFTGALVNVTGTLTLGNVILDGNRSEVTANAPIITAGKNAVLNIGEGAVLRNNAYPQSGWDGYNWINGGAVFADHATVNILAGSVIENNLAMYGGGIQMNAGTLNMSGGTIRNNTARATTYANNVKANGSGGGVSLILGAVMNLSGGAITGNKADGCTSSGIGLSGSTGGGIQLGAPYGNQAVFNKGARLYMTGGTISDNTAYAEGGGIDIQASCVATVTGGQITGNESNRGDFGGGGIYVNAARGYNTVNGLLKLSNVLITDNQANYGGGIACCETVHLSIYMGNGSAIYGNKQDDLFVFLRQTGVGTKATISDRMMNGSAYNWTYKDGTKVPEDLLAYFNAGRWNDASMVSHPDNTNVDADVIITGNKAKTKGGGIGSNGDVVIGDEPGPEDVSWKPEVEKIVYGRDLKEGEKITFTVLEEHANGEYYWNKTYDPDTVAGTGYVEKTKDGESAEIIFTGIDLGKHSISELGKVLGTFLVLEDPQEEKDNLVTEDSVYYAFTVVLGARGDRLTASTEIIQKGTYTRDEDGNPVFALDSYHARDREDIRAYYEECTVDGCPPFVNYVLDRTASVRKIWALSDGDKETVPDGASATFELFADGEPARYLNGESVQPVVLDGTIDKNGEEEAWTAVWRDLPIFADAGYQTRIVYTVKETAHTPDYFMPEAKEQIIPADGAAVIVNRQGESRITPTPTPVPEESPTPTPMPDEKPTPTPTPVPEETPTPEPTLTPEPSPTPEPELILLTIRKIWADDDNAAGMRPDSITMKLTGNGKTVKKVTLNERNGWQATVENLPKTDENGNPIKYSWSEPAVLGYVSSGTVSENDVTTFTNKLWKRPEGQKPPIGGKKPKQPGTPKITTELEDYGTPLGGGTLINHTGDCFD